MSISVASCPVSDSSVCASEVLVVTAGAEWEIAWLSRQRLLDGAQFKRIRKELAEMLGYSGDPDVLPLDQAMRCL
jgi:hypothetical protein